MRQTRWPSGWLVLAGLSALVAAGGCAAPPGFSFAAAADMRYFTPPDNPGSEFFVGVCEAIRDVGPGEFMITPGDADPPDRVRAAIDQILGPDYPWYIAVGNHEGDDPAYMEFLRRYNAGGSKLPGIVNSGPPGAVETCYSFDHGNAHFVAINQYCDGQADMVGDGDVSDAMYEWLATDLEANDKPFVFIIGHEPSVVIADMDNGRIRHQYTSLDKYPENNHRFWTLLRQHNVVAYFNGHTHNASVAKINGVWQIDCGHARGKGDPGARSTFVMVHVTPDSVRCDAYRADETGQNYQRTFTERLR